MNLDKFTSAQYVTSEEMLNKQQIRSLKNGVVFWHTRDRISPHAHNARIIAKFKVCYVPTQDLS